MILLYINVIYFIGEKVVHILYTIKWLKRCEKIESVVVTFLASTSSYLFSKWISLNSAASSLRNAFLN